MSKKHFPKQQTHGSGTGFNDAVCPINAASQDMEGSWRHKANVWMHNVRVQRPPEGFAIRPPS